MTKQIDDHGSPDHDHHQAIEQLLNPSGARFFGFGCIHFVSAPKVPTHDNVIRPAARILSLVGNLWAPPSALLSAPASTKLATASHGNVLFRHSFFITSLPFLVQPMFARLMLPRLGTHLPLGKPLGVFTKRCYSPVAPALTGAPRASAWCDTTDTVISSAAAALSKARSVWLILARNPEDLAPF